MRRLLMLLPALLLLSPGTAAAADLADNALPSLP